jgi:hypothetical protein
MNEQTDKSMPDEKLITEPVAAESPTKTAAHKNRPVIIVAIVALVAVVVVAWILWPKQAGKPVPAPRSVSFEESPGQSTAMTGDQKLTLTPEQLRAAGLKNETIGERPTSEAAGQMATGVV